MIIHINLLMLRINYMTDKFDSSLVTNHSVAVLFQSLKIRNVI